MSLFTLAAQQLSVAPAAAATSSPWQQSGFAYPPWVYPPDNFTPFDNVAAIAMPPQDGNDYPVLTITMPNGYDGVIRRLSHNYIGGGFIQGSGYILWRLLINGQAVQNYDAMTVEFGSVQTPRLTDGVRVFSGQTIQYMVNIPIGTGFVLTPMTQIVCCLAGWYYPRDMA